MINIEIENKNIVCEVIELTHIPLVIERQEQEKISLSNLILEYLRDDFITTSLELICTSCAVNDQLLAGVPHLYFVLYLSDFDSIECLKEVMNYKVNGLLCVLHRMGYQTLRLGTEESISPIIPAGLIDKSIYYAFNGEEKSEYQLREVDINTVYDNLISMMATVIPDSLFSISMAMEEQNVRFGIKVLSGKKELAQLIYFSFVEGMKINYSPQFQKVKSSDAMDYFILHSFSSNYLGYKEVSKFLQLPYGTFSGIPIAPQQRNLPIFERGIINGNDLKIGTVIGNRDKMLTLPLQNEVTHLSVLGISGSGKSNFLLYYLNEMYNVYGIPFLVIDPVSTEYRELKSSLTDENLNVFTPGSEISPFEFNLFALNCENLTVREYKSVLKDYLRNCLNLFSPLDKLIDETIDSIFLENGWYDISTKKWLSGQSFTINDVILMFDKVFLKSEFTGNLKNMASSGRVRLESLRRFFDTEATLPLEDILTTPTVIELGKLQSAEAKSTMLLYILNMVKLYMMDYATKERQGNDESRIQTKGPRLILVIDEAHSILEMQEQGEGMNVAQRGVIDTVNQLLLEYRKYGLSVVVADQRVSVLQDVLTNTHMQMIFKQIDPQGKQVAADIISLDEVQMLAEQKAGEAFVKHTLFKVPVQIQAPLYNKKGSLISDEYVAAYMKKDFWLKHTELTRPFKVCCKYCTKIKVCDRTCRSIAANIVAMYKNKEKPTLKGFKEEVDNVKKGNSKLFDGFKVTYTLQTCLCIHLAKATGLKDDILIDVNKKK